LSRPNVSSKFKHHTARTSSRGHGLLPPPVVAGLVIVQEGVVIFAFRYIFRSIALLGQLVVDKTKFTPLFSGRDAVQTDEEFSAVISVSILGMGIVLTKFISG